MLNPYEDSRTLVLIFCFWSKKVIWVVRCWKLRYFFNFGDLFQIYTKYMKIYKKFQKLLLPLCKFSPNKKNRNLRVSWRQGGNILKCTGCSNFVLLFGFGRIEDQVQMRKGDWKMLPTTLSTHTIVPWQLGHSGPLLHKE